MKDLLEFQTQGFGLLLQSLAYSPQAKKLLSVLEAPEAARTALIPAAEGMEPSLILDEAHAEKDCPNNKRRKKGQQLLLPGVRR